MYIIWKKLNMIEFITDEMFLDQNELIKTIIFFCVEIVAFFK